VATLADENRKVGGVAPLIPRQQDLSNISREIADSLKKQSEQSPNKIAGQGTGGESLDSNSQDAAHRLAQASEHVAGARQAMDEAIRKMKEEPKVLKSVEEDQGAAVQKLVEAIQMLSPPPEEQKEKQQEQQQAQQQNQGAAEKQKKQQQAQRMDMGNLLQSVRDREAQRRRNKRPRGPAGYAPVEKDW
jgi:chromosome segregation ATPase